MQADQRPPLRLLHHLARSGGTLISRCLASMRGVALLSEVHPVATAIHHPLYDPLDQARRWYGLVDESDCAERGRTTPERFADAIVLIEERCRSRGLALVLRDWSHLDFVGAPFRTETSARLETVAALAPRFALRRFATVRHPLPQWLSLRRILGNATLSPERYLAGCCAFAEAATETGFVRYEDFCADPAPTLAHIADALDLEFDPDFLERWPAYRNITGDAPATEGSAIRPQSPRRLPPGLAASFGRNADYRRTIEILGYDHAG